MNFQQELIISPDHPSLPGHFPGSPVVPGVVILDLVEQALQTWKPGHRIAELSNVKFISPLLPGQSFVVRLTDAGNGRVKFLCTLENQTLTQGQFKVMTEVRG